MKTAAGEHKNYKSEIIKTMRENGDYSDTYEYAVECLAQYLCDHDETMELFEKSGSKVVVPYTNTAGAKNLAQNPIYTELKAIRTNILTFSDALGLLPKKNKDGSTASKSEGKLISILGGLDAETKKSNGGKKIRKTGNKK